MKKTYKAFILAALLGTGACNKDNNYLDIQPKSARLFGPR
jgi:hypothetical protein